MVWHLDRKKRNEKEIIKKKGLRGKVGKVFKEKQREQERKKDLEEKKKRISLVCLGKKKKIL